MTISGLLVVMVGEIPETEGTTMITVIIAREER
jgi:hypothetical protein